VHLERHVVERPDDVSLPSGATFARSQPLKPFPNEVCQASLNLGAEAVALRDVVRADGEIDHVR